MSDPSMSESKSKSKSKSGLIRSPLLAATATAEDLKKLTYPMMASCKIDGLRCIMHPLLGPVTRKFKPIPNVYVRKTLEEVCCSYVDGELIALDNEGNPLDFNGTQSAIMSRDGEPPFKFLMFDYFEVPENQFRYRYHNLVEIVQEYFEGLEEMFAVVPHTLIDSAEEVLKYHHTAMMAGFEGVMLRDVEGPYKSGRSTLKQQILVKYKEFADAEGVVLDIEELMHNDNILGQDAFGHAKRSSHKENLRSSALMGALILHTAWGELRVGSGFDRAMREEIWLNRDKYIDKTVTFKYQPFGMQEGGLPRFPIFMHFREE